MQYLKIKKTIAEQIEAGVLTQGQKLPSERLLAQSFATTRITLREALFLLEAQGSIYREDRRGWFIAAAPLHYHLDKTTSFTEMALQQKRKPQTQIKYAKTQIADKNVMQWLNLKPFSNVYEIESIKFLDRRPVGYIKQYVRLELFPHLLDLDLSTCLAQVYQQYFNLHYHTISYQISVCSLFEDIATSLRATFGTPAIKLQKISYNLQGNPIDAAIEYWRQDCIHLVTKSPPHF